MKVFWFDTETSGTDHNKNGIIQLGYLLEVDGEVKERGEITANCAAKEISDGALKVNGYTRAQIAGFQPASHMYKELHSLFSKYVSPYDRSDKLIAAGYNVDFDLRFLRRLWYDNGDKYFGSFFAFAPIDPSVIFRYLQREAILDPIIKLTLSDMAEYLGVSSEGAHDAMTDVLMTRAVTEALTVLMRSTL